jgi:hypothetical protein
MIDPAPQVEIAPRGTLAGDESTRATGDAPDRHEQDRLFAPVQPTIPGSMSLDIP